MPRAGGEYVFIREAYGRLWGFLYGWTRFFVASTGGLAGLAAGFAIFLNIASRGALQAHALAFPLGGRDISIGAVTLVASAAIVLVTLVNCAAVVGRRPHRVRARHAQGLARARRRRRRRSSWRTATGRTTRCRPIGGACEGVPAAARGGHRRFRRRDARRDVGLQRVERGDVRRRRGQGSRPGTCRSRSSAASGSSRRSTSSPTSPTSTS